MSDDIPQLPDSTQHTLIVGRNGTGKTRLAWWLLSCAPLDRMPYIVFDYKGEELFRRVRRMRQLSLNDQIPREPGLYIVRPRPTVDEASTENFLWRVWQRGSCGLYFDEGYQVPNKAAWNAILTQGRSKHIPTITLAQRPTWLPRFVFSETNFYAVFDLNDRRDRKTVEEILPRGIMDKPRPAFHPLWYEVKRNAVFLLRPVPDDETTISVIEEKIAPRRRFA